MSMGWCNMAIQVHLDRIMLEKHMSLNELADRVGITLANLSKIKNNRINAIRFSTLNAICQALDCQPGDILEYTQESAEENSQS